MFQILHFEKPIPFMRFAKLGMVLSALVTVLALYVLYDRGLNWGWTSPAVPPSRWGSSSR